MNHTGYTELRQCVDSLIISVCEHGDVDRQRLDSYSDLAASGEVFLAFDFLLSYLEENDVLIEREFYMRIIDCVELFGFSREMSKKLLNPSSQQDIETLLDVVDNLESHIRLTRIAAGSAAMPFRCCRHRGRG